VFRSSEQVKGLPSGPGPRVGRAGSSHGRARSSHGRQAGCASRASAVRRPLRRYFLRRYMVSCVVWRGPSAISRKRARWPSRCGWVMVSSAGKRVSEAVSRPQPSCNLDPRARLRRSWPRAVARLAAEPDVRRADRATRATSRWPHVPSCHDAARPGHRSALERIRTAVTTVAFAAVLSGCADSGPTSAAGLRVDGPFMTDSGSASFPTHSDRCCTAT
jgi:hypothetical protein